MTALEDLIAAAMSAPPERREEALRLLQGQVPKPEPYFTLSELQSNRGKLGCPIERDRYFKPQRLSEVRKKHER